MADAILGLEKFDDIWISW